jgi:CheY-like chemotaxis protein
MIEIKLRELALVLDGTLLGDGDASVTSTVETDSRLIVTGSIFFAKPGEKADGHDFVSDAIKNGAIAAVVERELPDQINQIVATQILKKWNAKVTVANNGREALNYLMNEKFDVVFTSYGTIGWLPDLDKWADVISKYLKPNGQFVFVEFHPVVWMFDDDFKYIFSLNNI